MDARLSGTRVACGPMLFLHETHRIVGDRADEFEAAYRDVVMPGLASSDDARLLWYLHHAHGTGPSYTAVTIIGVRDAEAWARLQGRLAGWAPEHDAMRHEVRSKMLGPVPWSAIQEFALEDVPTTPSDREPALYMEDTVWPYPGKIDAYLEAARTLYVRDTIGRRLEQGASLLDVRGCFRTLVGGLGTSEVVLWQRVVQPEFLVPLLTREIPAEYRGPGTWMREALAYRDRWESRLLRTAAWSPLD